MTIARVIIMEMLAVKALRVSVEKVLTLSRRCSTWHPVVDAFGTLEQ